QDPFLTGLENFTQPLLDLFRPLSRRHFATVGALAVWAFLIGFRAVTMPLMNLDTAQQDWVIAFGFDAAVPGAAAGPLTWPLFSLFSFAVFLFQFWTVALLYHRPADAAPDEGNRAREFMTDITKPFSAWTLPWRIAVLLLLGLAIAAGLPLTGQVESGAGSVRLPSLDADPGRAFAGYGINLLAGMAGVLMPLQTLIFALVILSWLVIFFPQSSAAFLCQEWLAFFLGPFRRFRFQVGMLDLTPIVVFFGMGVVYEALNGRFGVLWFLYNLAAGHTAP
ncbi:MAG: YggT family protein, partial [Lentisphaerae bacterium]|nr:YggT family protein [Lentisphaerota bacterium]